MMDAHKAYVRDAIRNTEDDEISDQLVTKITEYLKQEELFDLLTGKTLDLLIVHLAGFAGELGVS